MKPGEFEKEREREKRMSYSDRVFDAIDWNR